MIETVSEDKHPALTRLKDLSNLQSEKGAQMYEKGFHDGVQFCLNLLLDTGFYKRIVAEGKPNKAEIEAALDTVLDGDDDTESTN